MIRTVLTASDTEAWLDVLGKYFYLGNEDDCETLEKVSTAVWQMMSNAVSEEPGDDGSYLSPVLGRIKIDEDDTYAHPKGDLAYMIGMEIDTPSTMHIGPLGLKLPLLDDVTCDQLGDRVSSKMRNLPTAIFHELTYEVLPFSPYR